MNTENDSPNLCLGANLRRSMWFGFEFFWTEEEIEPKTDEQEGQQVPSPVPGTYTPAWFPKECSL